MGLQDQRIDWVRKRRYWSYLDLRGLIFPAIDEAGAQAFTEGELLQNPTSASVVAPDINLYEVSTLGIVGLYFTAAGTVLFGAINLPSDLDPAYPVGFRINWSGVGTVAADKGVTWILNTAAIKKGMPFALGDIAGDVLFGESLINGNDRNEWTARQIRRALILTRLDIENGVQLSLSLELDIIDAGITFVKLLGLEIDYVPITTLGNGCHTDRPLSTMG